MTCTVVGVEVTCTVVGVGVTCTVVSRWCVSRIYTVNTTCILIANEVEPI